MWSSRLVASFRLGPSFASGPHDPDVASNSQDHLTTLIQPLSIQHSEVYDNALVILNGMQSSPSCHRLAASTLLNACQTFNAPPDQAEESLEDIRSQYAAQLAICEIVSAGSDVPIQCRSLIPSTHTSTVTAPGPSGRAESTFRHTQKRHLGHCLKTLESRPQWWTSYSNNRQNAAVMCQAARVDIEKGRYPVQSLVLI